MIKNFSLLTLLALMPNYAFSLPKNFVYLQDIDASIVQNLRYYGDENFLGRRLNGYAKLRAILTEPAAKALSRAQAIFNAKGYNIVVYDAYRPQKAVDDIIEWSRNQQDIIMKKLYYPRLNKNKLFELEYVMKKSSHTRGSTVDISIMPIRHSLHKLQIKKRTLNDGFEIMLLDDGTVDMGSSFDLFDEASHSDSKLVSLEHQQQRQYLKAVMEQCGFENLYTEWWHFTLIKEPFPDTYFNFSVE